MGVVSLHGAGAVSRGALRRPDVRVWRRCRGNSETTRRSSPPGGAGMNRATLVLSVVLILPASAAAQAKKEAKANLDAGLLQQAPKVVSYLCDKRYRRV